MRLQYLCCLAFVVLGTIARAEVLQVQVLHRHGARPHLRKARTDPADEVGGAELLTQGVVEMRRLGEAVRSRYIAKGGLEVIAASKPTYSSSEDFYAVSSQTSRTLSSSRAFIQGLYIDGNDSSTATTDTARIPTHVFASESRDWRLRGYTMCPNFVKAIESLLRSDDYTKKEQEVSAAGDLKKAGDAIGEETPDLAHAFNVYDRFVLAKGNYGDVEPEAAKYDLTDDAFENIKSAADWMESRKFGDSDVAGTLVSGGLLNDMIRRANAMLGQPEVGYEKTRMIEYSGHYPLLLGVFSALGLDSSTFTDAQSALAKNASTSIPAFASALVWELHTGGNVKLFWVAGGESLTFVPIPCGSDATEFACKLASISSRLNAVATSRAAFCSACGSAKDVNPDLCVASASVGGLNGGSNGIVGLGGFVTGILLGVLGSCLYVSCAGYGPSRRALQNATIQPLEPNEYSGGGSGEITGARESHFGAPLNK